MRRLSSSIDATRRATDASRSCAVFFSAWSAAICPSRCPRCSCFLLLERRADSRFDNILRARRLSSLSSSWSKSTCEDGADVCALCAPLPWPPLCPWLVPRTAFVAARPCGATSNLSAGKLCNADDSALASSFRAAGLCELVSLVAGPSTFTLAPCITGDTPPIWLCALASWRRKSTDGTRGMPGMQPSTKCWPSEASIPPCVMFVEEGMRFKNSWKAASESVRLKPTPAAAPMRHMPPTRSSTDMLRSTVPLMVYGTQSRGRGGAGRCGSPSELCRATAGANQTSNLQQSIEQFIRNAPASSCARIVRFCCCSTLLVRPFTTRQR
mmetsp:Transcript_20540/g.61243  ORF Transcript_20540/g.61243 Transcript_20540/m.61243 type:complete len:326 (-) Transcript_20540:176-1153(-)